MPLCYLQTNVPNSNIKDGVEERIAAAISTILNKPLERIIVVLVPNARLFRLGSTDPACNVMISSIGVFDRERNPSYTEPIKQLVMEEFGLARERISLVYHDLDRDFIGE